jgi:hypothetical protein
MLNLPSAIFVFDHLHFAAFNLALHACASTFARQRLSVTESAIKKWNDVF